MSQPADPDASAGESAPAVEPFASILEYAARLGPRHIWMLQQLARLRERPEPWIVSGPTRIEDWHVGAIAVGPPGIFLIWVKTTRTEPALWSTLRQCRAHVQRCLGEHGHPSVEIVLFSPTHQRGHMQRWMDIEDDMLTAYGSDLDRLLVEWEPVSGVYLSDRWIARVASASRPRETLYGPDRGAQQTYPRYSPPRAQSAPDPPTTDDLADLLQGFAAVDPVTMDPGEPLR
jgi:hypothetical protein